MERAKECQMIVKQINESRKKNDKRQNKINRLEVKRFVRTIKL